MTFSASGSDISGPIVSALITARSVITSNAEDSGVTAPLNLGCAWGMQVCGSNRKVANAKAVIVHLSSVCMYECVFENTKQHSIIFSLLTL
jgi:hypothetical protein